MTSHIQSASMMEMTELTPTEDVYTPEQCFISTASGRKFYLSNPEFYIPDIAHALSMNCRFNGHCTKFFSVAEHSVIIAKMMQHFNEGNPLEGLLHDATEAYLSDMPAPFKQNFRELALFDKALDSKFREYVGLPLKCSKECKKYDWICLYIEEYWLSSPHCEAKFSDPFGYRPIALELAEKFKPQCLLPNEGKQAFLEMYEKLR